MNKSLGGIILAALTLCACSQPAAPPPVTAPAPLPAPKPVPEPAPPPAAPPTSFVAGGPLIVGGYAWSTSNQPQGCCQGIIQRVIAGPLPSSDVVPQPMWLLQFYADPTGNFPVDNPYWTTLQNWWPEKDIQGLTGSP